MFNPEQQLKEELTELLPDLTLKKMWTIVKLCKRVRLRCRTNTAFNNMFSRLFPDFSFREVVKDNKFGKGLQIDNRKNPDEIYIQEGEDDD